ncbi:MAG: 7-cyano-7-deazaguanine synthase [bacterium]
MLPESKPDIWLDDTGICSLCAEFEKKRKCEDIDTPLETDFVRILNQNRGKGEYDCLVMCSGGKDSTAALYYMKKRYKLNPLAFTFDHGFETDEALENIHNAVKILGVDFLYFKTEFIKDMISEILKTDSKAVICHPCSIWYMDLTFKMAERFNIPIIIAGWTKGQSTKQPLMSKCGCSVHQPGFASMASATRDFLADCIKKNPKYKGFPASMEEVLARAQKKHKCLVLSPHWFLPFDAGSYVEIIQKELKWKLPELSYPARSTNCYLNFISVHNSMKYYGYTHYHAEMSKMVREGLMSREQAMKDLEINFDRGLLNKIASKLDHEFAPDEP